jgi:hypothetical protein
VTAGALEGPEDVLGRLRAAGIATVADVLARAEPVRDLPDRANLVLRAGPDVVHVKRSKSRRPSAEAAGMAEAAAAGVPVPRLAFRGLDRRLGSVVGTFALAPARPFDDLLRERALAPEQVRSAWDALADATARLHKARRRHRDLYLCHVFVDPSAPRPGVTIIDWERSDPEHGALGGGFVKDLAAIESSVPDGTLSCPARARFLVTYLRGRGFPVRTLLGPLLRRVVKKAARIRAHAPRTPVGDAALPRRSVP